MHDCVSAQVLDAVPQQPEGVRSRPSFNSQSSSAEQSFSSQLSSEAEEGSRSKKPGDFQTIFGEFRPGQTFATLQSLDGNPRGGSNIGPQSSRIPPTPIPQTINQQRFEQNQIVEQPQRFRQPQRFEQTQRFDQPRTTAQPQRFEQPRTSVQPQRFEQPRTGQAQNFAQNPRFSPQQPSRSQRPGSVQRFIPQLQNSEGVQRFEQRQQENLNQFEENRLNLGSSNSNLRQNSFQPPSVPQQPVRQSGFQQVHSKTVTVKSVENTCSKFLAPIWTFTLKCDVNCISKLQDTFDSFFSGSTFPSSFPAMETSRLTLLTLLERDLLETHIRYSIAHIPMKLCSGRVFRATRGSRGTPPTTST